MPMKDLWSALYMHRDLICLRFLLQKPKYIRLGTKEILFSNAGNVFVAIYISLACASLSDRGLNIIQWIV